MNSVFHREKDSYGITAGRMGIIAAALLFLLLAAMRSLPDTRSIRSKLDENAVAGYERVSITTPYRESVLAEFYDSPSTDRSVTTAPSSVDKTPTPK